MCTNPSSWNRASFQRWFICHCSGSQRNSSEAFVGILYIFCWLFFCLDKMTQEQFFGQQLHLQCPLFHVSLQTPVEGHILLSYIFNWNAMSGKKSTMFNWIGAVVLFSRFWQSQTMTMQKFLLSCKTFNLFAIFAVLLIYLWFPEKIGIICKNDNGFCLLYGW